MYAIGYQIGKIMNRLQNSERKAMLRGPKFHAEWKRNYEEARQSNSVQASIEWADRETCDDLDGFHCVDF